MKRKFTGRSAPMKKRRLTRRRRSSGRTSFMTSQKGGAIGAYLSKRRPALSARSYRKLLWKSTVQKEHFRSVISSQSSLTTTADARQKVIGYLRMFDPAFYTTAGGALVSNTFTSDLIIRGGMSTLSFVNNELVTLKVEVYKLFFKDNIPTLSGTVDAGWDPTNVTDFQEYYSVGQRKLFSIEPGDTATLTHRLGVKKVDASQLAAGYRMPVWLITVCSPAGSIKTLNFVVSHNMSFSGDALT